MKDEKLAVTCERIFEKLRKTIDERGDDSHAAYLQLCKTLKQEDKKLGRAFDDLKRSNAILKLVEWRRCKLLSDEELKRFSDETQELVRFISTAGK